MALHLSGFFASFLSGYAANCFGARSVLIAFAVSGELCSISIGWLGHLETVPLRATARNAEATTGVSIERIYVDKGFRGHD